MWPSKKHLLLQFVHNALHLSAQTPPCRTKPSLLRGRAHPENRSIWSPIPHFLKVQSARSTLWLRRFIWRLPKLFFCVLFCSIKNTSRPPASKTEHAFCAPKLLTGREMRKKNGRWEKKKNIHSVRQTQNLSRDETSKRLSPPSPGASIKSCKKENIKAFSLHFNFRTSIVRVDPSLVNVQSCSLFVSSAFYCNLAVFSFPAHFTERSQLFLHPLELNLALCTSIKSWKLAFKMQVIRWTSR